MTATNFDGAWKEALDHYLPACIQLLFPDVYAGIDWTQPVTDEPLVLLQINPETATGTQYVDKLVQVTRSDGEQTLVFVHLEIQAQRDEGFAQRIFRYHTRLFDRHVRPVVSLAILADDDPHWNPTSFGYTLWSCRIMLHFPTIKLLELDAATLAASSNPLAMVILIHRDAQATRGKPEERMQRKVARFRTFFRNRYQPEDLRRIYRILEHILRLPPPLQAQAHAAMRQIEQEENHMSLPMVGLEKIGYLQGHAEGQQELVLRQLKRRCGEVSDVLEADVLALAPLLLLDLSEALLDFTSPDDLQAWLQNHQEG